jgi:hypothetical protein
MTIKEHKPSAVSDPRAQTLSAATAARHPQRPARRRCGRLPQISALATALGLGVAGVAGTATLGACTSSTGGHPQPGVTSGASHRAAVAHKKTTHPAGPSSSASAGPTLKPPGARPAPGKSYGRKQPHATSSAS